LTRRDWLLLALAHREGRPLSPAQIQKSMFLLAEEMAKAVGRGFYRFSAYNYGPFCRDIYDDLDSMVATGLVTLSPGSRDARRTYAITPAGMKRAAAIQPHADPAAFAYLGQAVDWAASLSFTALVRAIYAKYPKYRENSVFVD